MGIRLDSWQESAAMVRTDESGCRGRYRLRVKVLRFERRWAQAGGRVDFRATDQGTLVTRGGEDPVETLYGKLAGKTSLTMLFCERGPGS